MINEYVISAFEQLNKKHHVKYPPGGEAEA